MKKILMLLMLGILLIASACSVYMGSAKSSQGNKQYVAGYTIYYIFTGSKVWLVDPATGEKTEVEVEYK